MNPKPRNLNLLPATHLKSLTLRDVVMSLPEEERLEFALEAYEQATGQGDGVERWVKGVHLSPQEYLVFRALNRHLGNMVARDRLMSILAASTNRDDIGYSHLNVIVSHLRKRLKGKYEIEAEYKGGYRLTRIKGQSNNAR